MNEEYERKLASVIDRAGGRTYRVIIYVVFLATVAMLVAVVLLAHQVEEIAADARQTVTNNRAILQRIILNESLNSQRTNDAVRDVKCFIYETHHMSPPKDLGCDMNREESQ